MRWISAPILNRVLNTFFLVFPTVEVSIRASKSWHGKHKIYLYELIHVVDADTKLNTNITKAKAVSDASPKFTKSDTRLRWSQSNKSYCCWQAQGSTLISQEIKA